MWVSLAIVLLLTNGVNASILVEDDVFSYDGRDAHQVVSKLHIIVDPPITRSTSKSWFSGFNNLIRPGEILSTIRTVGGT